MNLIKHITINVNNYFFSVFWYQCFRLSEFLWGQKIQLKFEKGFVGILYRFVIPTLRQCQEAHVFSIFFIAANLFSPKRQKQFSIQISNEIFPSVFYWFVFVELEN